MPYPDHLLFVLADGAHARFVKRDPRTGAFVTVRELDGSQRLKSLRRELRGGSPPGRSQESASSARHGLGRDDYTRQAKQAFVTQVAQEAAEFATPNHGLVVVAPAKLGQVFRERLGDRLAAVVAKDLIKTPDAELGRWLEPMALRTRQPVS